MNIRTIGIAVIVVALVVAFTGITSADPDGATGSADTPVTKPAVTAGQDAAEGGYIAEFNLSVTQQTAKWQGYYGNITAGITLDDASSTMYSWTTATPAGEVYATTLSTLPVWTNFNNSADLGEVDSAYGFVSGESDNAAGTFSLSTHAAFYLAGNEIVAGTGQCAKTTGNWETVILHDGSGATTGDYIFAGIIKNDQVNYKGGTNTSDYQMIIPENPSSGTTPYYFYAEIT